MIKNFKNYAYADEARTILVRPDSPNILDYVGKPLYCKNPNCPARMFIRKADKPEEAYFQASGKPAHIGSCGLIGNIGISKRDFDEAGFHYLDALHNLEIPPTKKGVSTTHTIVNPTVEPHVEIHVRPRPLRTLKEIHKMASHVPPEDTYGDVLIRDLLVDNRTLSYYDKGFDGYKIVEAKLRRYTDTLSDSYVIMDYSFDDLVPHYVKLKFVDKHLLREQLPHLYNTKYDSLAVIAGNFKKIESQSKQFPILCECIIYSTKQIAIYT